MLIICDNCGTNYEGAGNQSTSSGPQLCLNCSGIMSTSGVSGINLSADEIWTIPSEGDGEIRHEERRVSDENGEGLQSAETEPTENQNAYVTEQQIEYERYKKTAENCRVRILKRLREVRSNIYNFEKSTSTYSSENAIDFVNMEREMEEHFKDAPNEVKGNAWEVFERFKGNTIQECAREMKHFTDILDKLLKLKMTNDDNLAITFGNFLNNGNFIELTALTQLSELEGEVATFETKLFELKFDNEGVEIVSRNIPWNLVVVFGPYFNEYIEQNAHKRQLSENRFETTNGVTVYWKGKDFEAYSESTYHGIRWYEILENTQLIFTIPNNFSSTEIEKIQKLMKDNANINIKIGIKAEMNEAINAELEAWLKGNNKEYFRIHNKLAKDINRIDAENEKVKNRVEEFLRDLEQRLATYTNDYFIDLEKQINRHYRESFVMEEQNEGIVKRTLEEFKQKIVQECEEEREKYEKLLKMTEEIAEKCKKILAGDVDNIPEAYRQLEELVKSRQQLMQELQNLDRRWKTFEVHFGSYEIPDYKIVEKYGN